MTAKPEYAQETNGTAQLIPDDYDFRAAAPAEAAFAAFRAHSRLHHFWTLSDHGHRK
jgi:hypothetical protein